MIPFSHTILGRFLAIVMIIYATQIDFVFGLFTCVIIIYYYQMDKFQNILNIPEGFLWELTRNPENHYLPYDTKVYDNVNDSLKENFTKENFTKEHCKNGNLMNRDTHDNKEYIVRPEMATHIFPQLEFTHDSCNPCNPRCKFSILENKFRTEEEIVKPKNSNDWFHVIVPNFR